VYKRLHLKIKPTGYKYSYHKLREYRVCTLPGTYIAVLKLILIQLLYICLVVTNHNHYNFADSIHQHYKKHIIEEMSSI